MSRISIELERYDEEGWVWTQTVKQLVGEPETTTYRTNQWGDGLWQWCSSPSQWYSDGSPYYEYRQVLGTCQFSLPPIRQKAYSDIRHWILCGG